MGRPPLSVRALTGVESDRSPIVVTTPTGRLLFDAPPGIGDAYPFTTPPDGICCTNGSPKSSGGLSELEGSDATVFIPKGTTPTDTCDGSIVDVGDDEWRTVAGIPLMSAVSSGLNPDAAFVVGWGEWAAEIPTEVSDCSAPAVAIAQHGAVGAFDTKAIGSALLIHGASVTSQNLAGYMGLTTAHTAAVTAQRISASHLLISTEGDAEEPTSLVKEATEYDGLETTNPTQKSELEIRYESTTPDVTTRSDRVPVPSDD